MFSFFTQLSIDRFSEKSKNIPPNDLPSHLLCEESIQTKANRLAAYPNSCHYIYTHHRAVTHMNRKYISIKEASKMLGVTPLTLRNWDKRGILTAYRNPVNNYRVYRLDQIELFQRRIENSKNKSKGRRIDISIS